MEPEDTLVKAPQTKTQTLAKLCPMCHEKLNPSIQPSIYESHISHKQTFEYFREAVFQECVICSLMWNLTDEHPLAWSQMRPESWEPVCAYRTYHTVSSLTLRYVDPINGEAFVLRLNFIELNDPRYNISSLSNAGPCTSSALGLAYDWFTRCKTSQHHANCNQTRHKGTSQYPTRLIDIGKQNATDWTLRVMTLDGKPDSNASYMTLSYRWGENPTLVLLKSNLDDLRAGSPICNLPSTFRDFITVARKFSVRYVWIDALCIIQDSDQDWEAEAPMMRYVYANSVCNVAASASSDPEGGLFRKRLSLMPALVSASLFSDKSQEYIIVDKHYWKHELNHGPLQKRGWVFQELLLAPRILYFGHKQMLWECSEEKSSEFETLSGILPEDSPPKNGIFDLLASSSELESGRTSNELQRSWMNLVQEYSSCVLTRPSDKLFAFSGIAKLFQSYTNDVYIAGLWRSGLLSTMDWYVKEPKPLCISTYRAPSWSWAALDGPVLPCSGERIYDAKVIDLHFTTGSDPTVDVADARLRLIARTVPVTYHDARIHGGNTTFTLMVGGYRFPRCQWYPDYTEASKHDTFTSEGKITCMLFKRWEETQLPIKLSFFILQQVECDPSELTVKYRRIGYMEVHLTTIKQILLLHLSMADITIV